MDAFAARPADGVPVEPPADLGDGDLCVGLVGAADAESGDGGSRFRDEALGPGGRRLVHLDRAARLPAGRRRGLLSALPAARRRPRPRVRRVLRHRWHRHLARLLRGRLRPLLPARAPATRRGRRTPCAPVPRALPDVALPAGGVQRIALSPLLRRRIRPCGEAQVARRRRRHRARAAHAPRRDRARSRRCSSSRGARPSGGGRY